MSTLRVNSCQPEELKETRQWLADRENLIPRARKPSLKKLVENQCLLLARSKTGKNKNARNGSTQSGKILGVAGLELQSASICLLTLDRNSAVNGLLTQLERLAISFGLLQLHLPLERAKARRLKLSGYQADQERFGVLQRNLSRRLTQQARKALQQNQQLGVPADYGRRHNMRLQAEPDQLASIGQDVFDREQFMLPKAAAALQQMINAAAAENVEIQVVSAFRSVDYQCALIQDKLDKGQHMLEIMRVSAAPGYSEHHSGRAVDLTTPDFKPLEEQFAKSAAFKWLSKRAGEFGFRLSYPKGNRHGVAYEPWHWYYHC